MQVYLLYPCLISLSPCGGKDFLMYKYLKFKYEVFKMRKLLIILVCILSIFTVSCSSENNRSKIIVFGASSLESVLKDITKTFEKDTGIKVELNLGGSQRLSTQIEQGLPVNLFISANTEQAEKLEKKNLLFRLSSVAYNKVVFAVSEDSNIKELQDLTGEVRIALARKEVPIGKYGRQILNNLSEKYLDKNFKDKVFKNVVSLETSVKQVVARIATGQVDGGFVYATDVLVTQPPLKYLKIPDKDNVRTKYIMGVTLKGQKDPNTQKFYDFLLSNSGQDFFKKYGFNSEE